MGCLSFTPSLLPRGGVVQGLIWGITAAIGYGLGVLFAWIWRAFADREPRRPRHRSWLVFFISAAVLVVVSFGLGQYWQYQIRKLMAVTDYSIPLVIASPFVAAAVFCLLLLIGRGLRGLYRWAAQLLSRRIGRRAARATGWTLVAGLAYLAVRDLQRAGGFGRKNLLVVTTTGSGWVDPALSDSFEYLSGGDSATVAIQYSYLPSWISYLVDQSKAREAGRALFDAVYGAWTQLPAGQRPRLYVAGESLGSFGGETAFSGEYSMANLTGGVLFAGPPNFNTLFREFTDHRDPGSPEVQPAYQDGRIVRFADDATTAIPPPGRPWDGTRVLYMMHPSDPIVWWSPHLIFSEPDWISEPPGKDVLSTMFWMPFVTFWQVTADLPFATGVPAGHGHKYTTEYVDGFNAIMQPAGITPQDLADLRKIIASEE